MATGSGSDPRGARLLVVDDEGPVLAVLTKLIEQMGHAARCARSAEEALELLKTERFDLILLDVGLPGMTGFQALERIAAVSEASVVLMSGHADDEFRKDALLLGAKGLLKKPFGAEELKACLPRLGY